MEKEENINRQSDKKKVSSTGFLNNSEFMALTTLLTHMDENFHNEIKAVREDTKNTFEEIRKVNGRLHKTEEDVIKINKELDYRGETCFNRLKKMEPSQKLVDHLNFVSKHYKKFIIGLILLLIIIQTIVDVSIDNQWVADIIKWFK